MNSTSKILERRNQKLSMMKFGPRTCMIPTTIVSTNQLQKDRNEELKNDKCNCPWLPRDRPMNRSYSSPLTSIKKTKNLEQNEGFMIYLRLIKSCMIRYKSKPTVVVFDFDKTITKNHTRGCENLPESAYDRIIHCCNNLRSPDVLKSFLDYLKMSKIDIWIASYATSIENPSQREYSGKDLIHEYISALYENTQSPISVDKIIAFQSGSFSNDYFDACRELDIDVLKGGELKKSIHLQLIAKRLEIPKDRCREICLIDDDDEMINSVKDKFSAINIEDLMPNS